ncbi:MAG TPA: hypothetical protein VK425_10220, partial [Acidimicrobiales bacterium]|nr:hypothetical protein [Acidimicrobiales bacterium]
MSRKPQRRLAHAVPAVAIALALLPGAASANEDVPSSWAMGQTLYAYATGTAPAEGLTGCPLTTDSSQQCDLAEAIVLAKPGTTVALATPPTVADYVGNWAVGWDLSLARRAGPVTIEPAPGVTGPVLSGNYGHHDGCQTGTCRGPVLRVEGTATVRLFGIDINDAQDTTGLYGYSDQNAFGGAISDDGTGLLIISGCTFSRDIAGEPGGMNGEDIGNGGAIANVGVAPIIISRSTFAYDSAGLADGGAIYNDFGTVDITGSTFHGDRAGMGGAIKNTTS